MIKTQQARINDLEGKLKKMEAQKTKEDESKLVNKIYNSYASSVWKTIVPKVFKTNKFCAKMVRQANCGTL